MFVLTEGPITVSRTVTIKKPVDGEAFKEEKFKATFEIIGQEEFQEITGVGSDLQAVLAHADTDKALLRRVLVGWDGVNNEAKDPIEFSEDVRDNLIDINYVKVGLVRAYMEAMNGRKIKN